MPMIMHMHHLRKGSVVIDADSANEVTCMFEALTLTVNVLFPSLYIS